MAFSSVLVIRLRPVRVLDIPAIPFLLTFIVSPGAGGY